MKLLLITLVVIVYVAMEAASYTDQELKAWTDFKQQYEKKYENDAEDKKRLEIFLDNKRKVEEHNIKYRNGEVTWEQGLNSFSDLTVDEFRKTKLGLAPLPERRRESNLGFGAAAPK